MGFKESSTKENLVRAFAEICQDNARLGFIIKKAKNENFAFIALELEQMQKNKMAHATIIYELMLEYLEKTNDNVCIESGYPFESQSLSASIRDYGELEQYKAKNTFKHFEKIARDEGFNKVADIFKAITFVNDNNAKKLFYLADRFDNKTLYKSKERVLWECSNCGYADESKAAWDNCPLCNYPKGYVKFNLQMKKD